MSLSSIVDGRFQGCLAQAESHCTYADAATIKDFHNLTKAITLFAQEVLLRDAAILEEKL